MAGSWKKFDYRLRPAKSIERKMLVEAFRRLSEFGRVDMYRYVGFGSLYFTDFLLFHKTLGFKSMVSIEDVSDPTQKARFEFNRPYQCIDMRYGHSNAVLPALSWEGRSVIWLDYDGILDKDVLKDIGLITSRISPGSVLLVSVNANLPRIENDENAGGPTNYLDALKKQVGSDKVPSSIKNTDLAAWGTAQAYREIIHNEINEKLGQRNGILPLGSRIKYEQLFNFHYSDNAKMLTVGGIFFDEAQRHIFSKCGFDNLDFYREGKDSYLIDPPLLTFREMRALEQYLPDDSAPATVPISTSDKNKYERVYRFFPNYTEVEI